VRQGTLLVRRWKERASEIRRNCAPLYGPENRLRAIGILFEMDAVFGNKAPECRSRDAMRYNRVYELRIKLNLITISLPFVIRSLRRIEITDLRIVRI